MSRYFNYTGDDYVAHFGIKGMKWGIRRFQKSNGYLTSAGRRDDKKSDRQLKLEAKYQQKGKSKAEAEAAAKKRIKIEKNIATSAGIALGAAGIAYSANTKRGRARSMKQAGVSDSDIAKQLNISEADVKKLTSKNKGYALASDYTRKYGGSKAFAMKKMR